MLDNSVLAGETIRHGAYVCLRLADAADARAIGAIAIPALAETLGLRNEFAPGAGPPSESIAFLRRRDATPGAIADDGLEHADAVVHVAAPTSRPVSDFCAEAARLLGSLVRLRILGGVVRPRTYTGAAMNNFAYAHAVVQQPGTVMPHGFLIPMRKTAEWWKKDWMERHTYFLPRYDDAGRMTSEGHALASAAGIPCLLYGPGVIRGSAEEDDACVLVSEMVTVTRVLALTALDVCQRAPAELAIASRRR